MRQRIGVLLVTALLLVGTVVPAAAGAMAVTGDTNGPNAVGGALVAQQSNETAGNETTNDSVDVSTGAQLATVLAVTNDDIQTEVDETAFDVEYEDGDDETRVEAVATRGAALRERAEAIRADYETATAAYENGSITASQYAQRLATLNARAENVVRSYERLEVRSEGLSALELRAAGLNESALRTSVSDLDDLRGVGAAALFERFTGEREGELELRTADGLRIEFESEDGEESREFSRPRDADRNITVSQSAALDTAQDILSTPANGEWTLERASVHPESGYYKFEFVLDSASSEGEAEVRVDGSTGEVFRLEEEIEARDGDDEDDDRDDADNDRDDDDDDRDDRRERLRLLVVDGTVAPGESVTVQVLADGTPVEGATVTLNDRSIGTTDADGTVDVTLPTDGEAEFRAEHGEAEGELEFEFGEDDDDRIVRDLRVDAEQTDGRVTVTVTYQGNGVADATVFADGERVGTTDADGVVSFDATIREDLELEIVKGEFEAELTLVADGDTLRVGEVEVDGDDDSDDDRERDDESDDDRDRDDDDSDDRDEEDRERDDDDDESDDDRDRDDDDSEDDDRDDDDSDSGSDGGR
ncbi:hypothetical protein SAMN04487949_0223 [Halogranum gelatinilyticum]|uniref:DUF7096 domain-containing protein n=1 Tax=Halogranum gelatinilyticum TaxID=660521 RepID=A0A1G9P446_9EURY|nr:hypothetical protein [Halogranum gelatinilyticum]SDL93313.1 hypothetical protein SAMN04487949_0223 [Halogranum gelatinilyticum]